MDEDCDDDDHHRRHHDASATTRVNEATNFRLYRMKSC